LNYGKGGYPYVLIQLERSIKQGGFTSNEEDTLGRTASDRK
ncbi:unnamed protein product, partial [marine sediment metagenome]